MNGVEINERDAPIIWKEKAVGVVCRNFDEDMQNAVRTLKTGDEQSVERMLRSYNNVNWKSSDGNTLLHWAATLGHMCAVRLLLDAGANCDSPNVVGATPLHCAAFGGSVAVIDELLLRGANAMAKNRKGHTMFDFLKDLWGGDLHKRYEGLERLLTALSGSCYDLPSPVTKPGEPPEGTLASQRSFRGKIASCFLQNMHERQSVPFENFQYEERDEDNDDGLLQKYHLLEVKELLMDESAKRNELVREHLTWAVDVMTQLRNLAYPVRCVEEVVEVLAKKDSPEGDRWLLLRAKGASEGSEVWVRLKDLCECYPTRTDEQGHIPSLRHSPAPTNLTKRCHAYNQSNVDVYRNSVVQRVMRLLKDASARSLRYQRKPFSNSLPRFLEVSEDESERVLRRVVSSPWHSQTPKSDRGSDASFSTGVRSVKESVMKSRRNSGIVSAGRDLWGGVSQSPKSVLHSFSPSISPVCREKFDLSTRSYDPFRAPDYCAPTESSRQRAGDGGKIERLRRIYASQYLKRRFDISKKS